MATRIVGVEIREDGNIYDKAGLLLCIAPPIPAYHEVSEIAHSTVELVKLGVTVDEIIKLKNMELI